MMNNLITSRRVGKLTLTILAVLYVIIFNLQPNQQITLQSRDLRVHKNISATNILGLTQAKLSNLSTLPLNPNSVKNKQGLNLFCDKNKIRSGYCVVSNVVRAKKVVGYDDSVTLTTQGTAGFIIHIREVCRRWQGPISLAVYAPGSDLELAGSHVNYLKNCGLDKCVSDWVTWHVIYDINHQPNATGDDWLARDCREPIISHDSYVNSLNLMYPINVARNVARLNANTKYVFASDIELYPSLDIIPEFLKMVQQREILSFYQWERNKREVYVLPVFEVNSTIQSPPASKPQLFDMYKNGMAVSFHRYTCGHCHQIPDLDEWLYKKIDSEKSLDIFKTVKRNRAFKLGLWEPFFIGTNDFPLFDERFPWNGKRDKMQVALEMCFLDFDFHILDRAFLVHVPGIKVIDATMEAYRKPFIMESKEKYKEIRRKLKKMYISQANKMCA